MSEQIQFFTFDKHGQINYSVIGTIDIDRFHIRRWSKTGEIYILVLVLTIITRIDTCMVCANYVNGSEMFNYISKQM